MQCTVCGLPDEYSPCKLCKASLVCSMIDENQLAAYAAWIVRRFAERHGEPCPYTYRTSSVLPHNTWVSTQKWRFTRQGRRHLPVLLTHVQRSALLAEPCVYCGLEPCMSVDRDDSAQGYTVENCQPCCLACNRVKVKLQHADFVEHLQRIALYSAERVGQAPRASFKYALKPERTSLPAEFKRRAPPKQGRVLDWSEFI